MSKSKSAVCLVVFVVSIVAFCLACVCASMTGQISILPDDNTTNEFMDNVTNLTEDMINRDDNSYDDYSYSDSNDYSTDPMATVALTSKVDLDAKPKEFDKSNVVMFDKLTEEDMMQIQTNLLSLIEKLGIELPTADNNDLTA